jgi:Sulfotransferase family
LVAYEVRDVTLLQERFERLRGAELDLPKPGSRGNVYVLHLTGWVVGRDLQPVTVDVLYRGQVIRRAPVRGGRADVAAALGGISPDTPCTFHALVGLLGLSLDAELALEAVLEDGSRAPIGRVTVSRSPLRGDYAPRLQPLMLTCLGRTGSTWVMQLLTAHPEILVYRRFPYESAPGKYWMHALRVLSEPADLLDSAHPDSFQNDLHWVGKNPYWEDSVFEQPALANWSARTFVERLASFCQTNVDDWYMTLARNQGQEAAVYFAEKHIWPDFVPVLTRELYPAAREVFLVRDFRDMALSIMAFDERRGYAGFGRPHGATDEEYLRTQVRQMAEDIRASWIARRDHAHLLRYEDLVLQPRETLTALLGYLELDASPATIDRMLEIGAQAVPDLPGTSFDGSMVSQHQTSGDLAASIGRWRRERDPSFGPLCDDIFGDALAEFGYARSDAEPDAKKAAG